MNRIKIAGALVFGLSLLLALISINIANINRTNRTMLSSFSDQKEQIQEISKSIFYSYKKGERGSTIVYKAFDSQNIKIKNLWKSFHADVKKFRIQQQVATGYNSIITAKLVNSIYHKSVLLINEFNRVVELKKSEAHREIEFYKKLQTFLFFSLIILLFYLFTQLHFVIAFIQKFSNTSKKIIKSSTIQGVEPITIKSNTHELKEMTYSYNYMVKKMNLSIIDSSNSMTQSIKSLEEVAQNIENFMELLSTMNPKESDDFFKKEDAVIDSLDTLMSLRKRLKDLKIELDKLT
jgi:hypothetical protein